MIRDSMPFKFYIFLSPPLFAFKRLSANWTLLSDSELDSAPTLPWLTDSLNILETSFSLSSKRAPATWILHIHIYLIRSVFIFHCSNSGLWFIIISKHNKQFLNSCDCKMYSLLTFEYPVRFQPFPLNKYSFQTYIRCLLIIGICPPPM